MALSILEGGIGRAKGRWPGTLSGGHLSGPADVMIVDGLSSGSADRATVAMGPPAARGSEARVTTPGAMPGPGQTVVGGGYAESVRGLAVSKSHGRSALAVGWTLNARASKAASDMARAVASAGTAARRYDQAVANGDSATAEVARADVARAVATHRTLGRRLIAFRGGVAKAGAMVGLSRVAVRLRGQAVTLRRTAGRVLAKASRLRPLVAQREQRRAHALLLRATQAEAAAEKLEARARAVPVSTPPVELPPEIGRGRITKILSAGGAGPWEAGGPRVVDAGGDMDFVATLSGFGGFGRSLASRVDEAVDRTNQAVDQAVDQTVVNATAAGTSGLPPAAAAVTAKEIAKLEQDLAKKRAVATRAYKRLKEARNPRAKKRIAKEVAQADKDVLRAKRRLLQAEKRAKTATSALPPTTTVVPPEVAPQGGEGVSPEVAPQVDEDVPRPSERGQMSSSTKIGLAVGGVALAVAVAFALRRGRASAAA